MATTLSTNAAQFILDDFATSQLLLKRKRLVGFIHGEFSQKRFKKSRKTAKAILKDRRKGTGLYNTVDKMAEYLDHCFVAPERGPANPISYDSNFDPNDIKPVDRKLAD